MESPVKVSSSNGLLGIQINLSALYPNFFSLLASSGVTSFSLDPNTDDLVFKGLCSRNALHLPCDTSICTAYLASKSYDMDKVSFFASLGNNNVNKKICFVDIGANVGLITRQLYCSRPGFINAYYCYEPEKANFNLLEKNVESIPDCDAINCGLGADSGLKYLFLDRFNKGNHSYCRSAIEEENGFYVESKMISPLLEMDKWLGDSDSIIWKSDTQGMDETIATQLPISFWSNNVIGGTMELWNIPKQDFDLEYLCAIFDLFPSKFIQRSRGTGLVRVSTSDIKDFLQKGNHSFDRSDVDFFFAKG